MASFPSYQSANGSSLKRSFTAITISTTTSPERATTVSSTPRLLARRSRQRASGFLVLSSQSKVERQPRLSDMPSAAGPRIYENQIPCFMSVYGMDPNLMEHPEEDPPTKLVSTTYLDHQPLPQLPPQQEQESEHNQVHSHQHRESTSTQASDSTDSSPTTTISTVDSASLSDPSPSSSPASPITLVPLSSFPGSSFGLDSFQSLKMADIKPIRLPLHDERPMTSPSPRKFKNPKSLALNLSPSVETFQFSAPASPSFIKPPTLQGKRKPSLLSLNTGAANKLSVPSESGSVGIPTMLQRRGLKHSVSTPQMLLTPAFGPSGGMTLGERNVPRPLGSSRLIESNMTMDTFTIDEDADPEPPTGVQMATRVPGALVGGDSFDRPHSGEDAKSPSYPEGPILMYEPHVHLYLEPKIEEAMNFDVIINVAREVKNPFENATKEPVTKEGTASTTSEAANIRPDLGDSTPATATSIRSFRTAFEIQPSGSTESSPTTPKPVVEKKLPEYIHVPWDHNTDVKDELWDLCQTIEARAKEGRKILVHCQQGASRSATLIIAYGMYINQDLGPNEAYSLAQAKSRWVNPNMSLLFSLNDFKKIIDKKKAETTNATRRPSFGHRPTLSVDAVDTPVTPSRARGNSTPSVSARDNALLSKGDESKQSSSISETTMRRFADFDFGFRDTSSSRSGRHIIQHPQNIEPLHHVERQHADDWGNTLMSPRVTEMTINPLQYAFSRCYNSEPEVPPTPALFSPRVFEFPRSSFFPSPSVIRNSVCVDEDPRSPPTRGEAPIIRSIDDFL